MELDILGVGFKYFGMLVAAGGGGAAVVFGVFQFWGKGWLDSHFDKKLEAFKHEQAIQIEQFKHEQNLVVEKIKKEASLEISRNEKLNKIEFEILPSLWAEILNMYEFTFQLATNKNQSDDDIRLRMINFNKNFLSNAIFLDDKIHDSISEIRTLILNYLHEILHPIETTERIAGTSSKAKLEFLLNSTSKLELIQKKITSYLKSGATHS
ncbi:MAG TPA: hypothetical protein VG519_11390 [Pseudochrobactrum sp.]|nr:hypothetical protein [Pseudochrobactrum sp.]